MRRWSAVAASFVVFAVACVTAEPALASGPAFPNAPTLTNNNDGTVTIAGTGDSFWHIALQPSGGGSTTYPSPDVSALKTIYRPPAATPCVSVQAQSGGTGHADGQLGSWSGFVCATTGPTAFPNAPSITNNGNGTVTISGAGDSFWHMALQPSGGGTTTYPYPDLTSAQIVYAPPSSTPCVSVEAQSGGSGHADGQLQSWSPFTCATGQVPAFPSAPRVANNGNGSVTISGTGDSYWHLALQASGGGTTTYPWPDVPSSQTIYVPPSAQPCVSVQAESGGTGNGDGSLGSWSGFVCATGQPGYPNVGAAVSGNNASVTATSIGADTLNFVESTDAAGDNAVSVPIVATNGTATFRPEPDHPYVDVAPQQSGNTGTYYAQEPYGLRLHTTPPAPSGHADIGTNDAGGWGSAAAAVIRGGHISWARAEYGDESTATDVGYGFKVLQIVGNTPDSSLLTGVNQSTYGSTVVAQVQADPGATLLEAGNEMYYKGNVCDPVTYGKLYMLGLNALRNAGITLPYLFNMVGSTGGCIDATPVEWLRAALGANSGLASAILANGVAIHPYGLAGENTSDTFGTGAVTVEENLLQQELGAIPRMYITEFGYNTCHAGYDTSASSYQDAANKIQSAYNIFLQDPNIQGIWYFQSHDYSSTDCWGFMNNDNSTRAQFTTLSNFAVGQGQ